MGLFGPKMSEEEKRRQKWEKDVERMSARLLQVAASGDVVEIHLLCAFKEVAAYFSLGLVSVR